MTSLTIRNYLASLFPGDLIVNGASTEAPSISVFPGPEARGGKTPFLGGVECDDFHKMPINILVRWSTDTNVAYQKAHSIYKSLVGLHNFKFESAEIAFISLLDDQPMWVGRDSKNVVEFIIRADIYSYQEVSNEAL